MKKCTFPQYPYLWYLEDNVIANTELTVVIGLQCTHCHCDCDAHNDPFISFWANSVSGNRSHHCFCCKRVFRSEIVWAGGKMLNGVLHMFKIGFFLLLTISHFIFFGLPAITRFRWFLCKPNAVLKTNCLLSFWWTPDSGWHTKLLPYTNFY